MKNVFLIGLLFSITVFAQKDNSVNPYQELNTKPIDVSLFGRNGFTQLGPLDIPVAPEWYTEKVPQNSKLYHYHSTRISLGKEYDDSNKSSIKRAFEITNYLGDSEIAVVARVTRLTNEEHERFLIQVPPKASLNISFASLLHSEAVEFYGMSDFRLQSYLLDDTEMRLEQSEIAVSLPAMENQLKTPDPEDLCEFSRRGWMCLEWRVGLPHCIRIENQANGQGIVASMHAWYTCLEGYDGPWHQQAEVFYPTRDDLFHRAMVGDPHAVKLSACFWL